MPANLYPTNFDLDSLPNDAEREVVNSFLTHLGRDWYVVPSVKVAIEGNDFEIDVVLVSAAHGVVLVEVKGGIWTMKTGKWQANGSPTDEDPVGQVMRAKHSLVKRLTARDVNLRGFFMKHVVAFPHMVDFPKEGAGPDCERTMIFTKIELNNPLDAVMRLNMGVGPVPADRLVKLLKALRPDITEVQVNGDYVEATIDRIDDATAEGLSIIESLDDNARVLVHGPAGTGKTYLARRWVRRALERGESTLFFCFNRFLSQDLIAGNDELIAGIEDPPSLRTGTYHSLASQLLEDNRPPVPEGAGPEYWNGTLLEAFKTHLPNIPHRFDTLVIDEGQDIQAEWLSALSGLLTDPTAGRILMVADNKQAIYNVDWAAPREWMSLPLKTNLRNSRKIGAALQRIGGGEPRKFGPPGPDLLYFSTSGTKVARKSIVKAIQRAHLELDIPMSRIMVLTRHRALRDDLRSAPISIDGVGDVMLTSWAQRDEGSIICETIHATKGLEREAVILVNLDDEPDVPTTYIGASRATVFLSVIGQHPLADMLGLKYEGGAEK